MLVETCQMQRGMLAVCTREAERTVARITMAATRAVPAIDGVPIFFYDAFGLVCVEEICLKCTFTNSRDNEDLS